MSLFLRLSGISLGRYCQKNPAKSGGVGAEKILFSPMEVAW